ncbi:MAG TPA: hypothetical protein GX745_01370 [Clostridiales bacterium]|nr:hypothetical protein [Clostridiales bacterium]
MMDNEITRERLNNHLEYDWFKYILFILAAVFLWVFIYSMLDKAKDYQKLDIFVTVPISNEKAQEFETDFIEYLNALDDKTVKEVNFIYHDYYDQNTIYAILATSFTTYDLVLAQEDAFRYLAASGRLVCFDFEYDFVSDRRQIKGSVFDGFEVKDGNEQITINPYLNSGDFPAYYIFDQTQKDKLSQKYEEIEISDQILDKKFGIELNALGHDILLDYAEIIEDGQPTGDYIKYYMGVINPNLSKSAGGGNKGVFNALTQPIEFKHAWDAIIFLKDNKEAYAL